jgi:hypothetical protein
MGRLENGPFTLFDNLDDAACPRFNQNCTTIHHSVSVLTYTVLGWHVVIGNAFFRENRPNPQILTIVI